MRSIVISAVSAIALFSGAALANDQVAQTSSGGVTTGSERSMNCAPGTNDPNCADIGRPTDSDNDNSAGATSGTGSTGGSAGSTESTGATGGGTGSTGGGGGASGGSSGGSGGSGGSSDD
jgi:hypothetical protein